MKKINNRKLVILGLIVFIIVSIIGIFIFKYMTDKKDKEILASIAETQLLFSENMPKILPKETVEETTEEITAETEAETEAEPESEPIIEKKETEQKKEKTVKKNSKLKVVAYYPSWKGGDSNLGKLKFETLTHVNYAFAIPTSEGDVLPLENADLAKQVIKKAHNNKAKALLSVGGWSYQGIPLESTFVEATNSDEKITKLGDAIVAMCDAYGFDGIDIDWEHPRNDTKEQYEKLIVYLGEKLHEKGKLLTAAVQAGVSPGNWVSPDAAAHTDTVLNTVDWINVMAYEGEDGANHSTYDFAINCAKYWKDTRNLSGSKIVLGVPFYARPLGTSYEQLLAADGEAEGKDSTTYNGTQVYYNGKETIGKKTEYALNNLGGIMIWEITQDTTDASKSLLTSIGDKLR